MGKHTMLYNINKVLSVLLDDGRTITGKLLVFDKHMNVVLADASEEKPRPKKYLNETTPAPSRQLGLILLRGERVVSVTVQKGRENGAAESVNFSDAPKSAKAGAAKRKREE